MVENAKYKGVSKTQFFHGVQHLQALRGRLGLGLGFFCLFFVFSSRKSSFSIFSGEMMLITCLSKN